MDYLTPGQCRAARGLLDWSQPDLAERCGMHVQTISAFENETSTPSKRTLATITQTFEQNGIEFLPNEGIGRKTNPITIYRRSEGFCTFMDDVYETMKDKGGDVCVFNVDERLWEKFMTREKWLAHEDRMAPFLGKTVQRRILVKEGDRYIATSSAYYKWFPEGLFGENSFYSYADKMALIKFFDDDVEIMVLHEPSFTNNLKTLFNIAWDYAGIPIPDDVVPERA